MNAPVPNREWRRAGSQAEGERMLAYCAMLANPKGIVRVVSREFGIALDLPEKRIRRLSQELVRSEALERIHPGIYRVTGKSHVHTKRPDYISDARKHPSGMRAPRPEKPCTYATARALGIEPTLVIRPWVTSNGVYLRAVTLARVPSLERPLP